MPAIDFVGPAYTSRSLNLASDRLINMYVELNETQQGAKRAALFGTPGLRRLAVVPEQPCRGLYTAASGRVFGVWGSGLYEVFAAGPPVFLGRVAPGTSVVSMADNGTTLVLVDGSPTAYALTLATNACQPLSDPDFVGADRVGFLDGYFVFNKPETQQFYCSSLYDVTVDSLDFASAEGSPDRVVSLLVDHRELWLFGQQTTEVFFNSGNPDFPFDRISGAFLEHGCAAPHSVAKLDNTVYWLGADATGQGMVWKAAGYTPQRISTHAIEYALSTYPTLADAEAYTYQDQGHAFYVLTFPTGNATWGFDASTGLWHERAALDPPTGTLGRHRSRGYTFGHGRHLVGDWHDGRLYALDLDTFTDDGQAIKRLRAAPHVAAELHRVFHAEFCLDLEVGVGLDAGGSPGSDPQLMLRYSDTAGRTWSNERWTSAGALGHYHARAKWRRLGQSRDRVFEVSMTDPVKVVWLAAYLEATAGRA